MQGSQIIMMDFMVPSNLEASYCEKQVLTMLEKQLDSQLCPETRDIHGSFVFRARWPGSQVSTAVYGGPHDILLTVRFLKERSLLTVNIEAPFLAPTGSVFKDGLGEEPLFRLFDGNSDILKFEARVKEFLADCPSKSFPIISRGLKISPYWTTTDDRLTEIGITKVVHEERSQFQKIQIFDTIDFGRLLVLDDQANLAESDLIYTETLMNQEDFRDKQVLILGGGDGALLCELLKQDPTKVTMVELDDAVMRAVRTYMPKVAGGALDSYKGERSKVIVGDAVRYLEDSRRTGKQFDFIFGDLTDVPIATDHNVESSWDFISQILGLSFGCLRPGAKYLTHISGKSVPLVQKQFTEKVNAVAERLGFSCSVEFTEAFVPSFMEVWIFAQVSLSGNESLVAV